MPVYEYECSHCGAVFELLRSINAKAPRKCPECGETGGVTKLVSAPSFQFKGSGWYVTDYADKGKKKGSSKSTGDDSDSSPADAKKEDGGKKSEAKESKPEKSDKPEKSEKKKD